MKENERLMDCERQRVNQKAEPIIGNRFGRILPGVVALWVIFSGDSLSALDWIDEGQFRYAELEVPAASGPGFTGLSMVQTGVAFTNALSLKNAEINRILENGSGVAAGDVDNDGWCDLYFCGLEGPNVLYRNMGGLRFEDVTGPAGVACPGQMSTGTALADLDGDFDLDLLVNSIGGGTRCFLNDGTGVFVEKTVYGLSRTAGSTSLALADIDLDGDLDLYIANYQTITWKDLPPGVKPQVEVVDGKPVARPKDRFLAYLREDGSVGITEVGEPDRLYLNDGRAGFTPVSWTDGTFSDEDGRPLTDPPRHWGLSVMMRDINGDRAPDIYVCNDFIYGPDDVWINNGTGQFRRIERLALRSNSWSSMAIDFSDINRDGLDDFIVVDMLSREHARRMTQRANFETGSKLLPIGVVDNRPQTQRNTLFLNRGDGTFAELAQFAGVDASEWSWGTVFMDVDLDGYEDLLIATGHGHDLLDGDTTIQAMKAMREAPRGNVPRTLLMYPPLDLPNVAFRNRGDMTFEDVSTEWGFDNIGVSQGTCLADLDNDGDQEIVVNNLRDSPAIYRNNASGSRIAIRLKGTPPNTLGVGARITLTSQDESVVTQTKEIISGGRYQSSDQPLTVFAAVDTAGAFDLQVAWLNGRETRVSGLVANRIYEIAESESSQPRENRRDPMDPSPGPGPWFKDVSDLVQHVHHETPFNDFNRQPLLPRLLSQLGPAVAWHDVNGDQWEDLIVGSGAEGEMVVFENREGAGFKPTATLKTTADQTTLLSWKDESNRVRIIAGSSNYESGDTRLPSAQVLTFEKAKLQVDEPFAGQTAAVGPMVLADFDRDGDLDLFAGGRVNPARYPESPISRLYSNVKGHFRLDLVNSRKWLDVGMVSGAVASDVDGDGDADLVMACEWGPIRIWRNDDGEFVERTADYQMDDYRGWWNGVTTGDLDGDGRLDIVASNWGRNSKYQRHLSRSLRLYYGDVDRSGSLDVIESYFDPVSNNWVPGRDLIALGYALPFLQNQLHEYRVFSRLSLQEIVGPAIDRLSVLEVTWLDSTVFLNRGDRFEPRVLPVEAQYAPAFGVNVADFDGDGDEDIFLSQNFFATQPETSRYDAGRGLLLLGDGTGTFNAASGEPSGFNVYGEQRGSAVADFDRDGKVDLVVTQNGAATRLFRNERAKVGLRVRLRGPSKNRSAVGATMRLVFEDHEGPVREIHSGSGYWSQDSAVQVLGMPAAAKSLLIRWPDGERQSVEISEDTKTLEVPYPD